MLDTPILFLVFNRPKETLRVFEKIREAKPKVLFVAADGPREGKDDEIEKCNLVRQIATAVDWECTVHRLFRNENLGCGIAVSQAITWFFNNVEQGVILEDDCLPSSDFFIYCESMLNKYKDDERIMMVSGTNLLGDWKSDNQSYHFSYYGSIWGWASWRRAWEYYDYEMNLWDNIEVRERLKDILVNEVEYNMRSEIYTTYYQCKTKDTWDYQWSFSRLSQSGLSIVPAVNLVTNIGFGLSATHTFNEDSPFSNVELRTLKYPIMKSQFVMVDRDYDKAIMILQGVKRLEKKIAPKNVISILRDYFKMTIKNMLR
jgi:hypothetical protein